MASQCVIPFTPRFSKVNLCLPKKLQDRVYLSYIWLVGIQIARYLSYQTALSIQQANRSASCASSARCRAATSSGSILLRFSKDFLSVLIVATLEIGRWIFASRWWLLFDVLGQTNWVAHGCVSNMEMKSTNKRIHKGGDPVHSI